MKPSRMLHLDLAIMSGVVSALCLVLIGVVLF